MDGWMEMERWIDMEMGIDDRWMHRYGDRWMDRYTIGPCVALGEHCILDPGMDLSVCWNSQVTPIP